MKLTISQLADRIGAKLTGNCDESEVTIGAVGPVKAAGANEITFITGVRYLNDLKESQAGAVIVAKEVSGFDRPQLLVENIDAALIEVLSIFAPRLEKIPEGTDPTAKIADNVTLGKSISIGTGVVIETGVQIGDNTVISAGSKIGQNSKIGNNCHLDCNVVVYHNCTIGNNVIIQANTTIGATGFGYSLIDGAHRLIPHNGIVVIEDFVEIGTNTCIDRAKFGATRIGAGTKIDNLVQIAHNVEIGKCCLIVAQVGIAGSTKIGDGVIFAGSSGASDNLTIGDGAIVMARAVALGDIKAGKHVFGTPAIEKKEAFRLMGFTKRLPKYVEQLKKLTARVEKLETAKDDKK